MNRIVRNYIDRLYADLDSLRLPTDPTIKASRFAEHSGKGITYGVRVSLLRGSTYAEWSVLDAYRGPTLFTRLSTTAQKSFSLTHEGNKILREAAVDFAREIRADIYPVSDRPTFLKINSYESLDKRNPRSTFVADVSKYVAVLSQAAQQSILTPPTPKPTSIPTPSPTPPVTPVSSRLLYQNPRSRLMEHSIFMEPAYREAWVLWNRYGRDWKEIPPGELNEIGFTIRITGGRDKTVDIIPLSRKSDNR